MPLYSPRPIVILVNPQMGENIGATARAMKNFGLEDLRLVSPRDGWPNPQATATASGADSVLESTQVFDTFSEAIFDCHKVYATTARSRHIIKPSFTPASLMSEVFQNGEENHQKKIAFIFGAERSGLDNDVIALCHGIIHIPTNPDFWSLNLAQSVLLLAYEWFCHHNNVSNNFLINQSTSRKENHIKNYDHPCATHEQITGFFLHLEDLLNRRNFFFPDHKKESMIRNLRSVFLKANFNSQEIKMLHGIIRSLSSSYSS
jgi:tRNA/rRNA methyltransferase